MWPLVVIQLQRKWQLDLAKKKFWPVAGSLEKSIAAHPKFSWLAAGGYFGSFSM